MRVPGLIAIAVIAVGCSSQSTAPVGSGGVPSSDGGTQPAVDAGTASSPSDGGGVSGSGGSGGGVDGGTSTGGSGGTGGGGTGSGGGAGGGGDTGGGGGSGDGGGGSGSGSGGGGSGASDGGSASGGSADAGTVATGPQVLTFGENAVALAIDADNVYWLSDVQYTYQGGIAPGIDVRAMAKSGGPIFQIAANTPAPAVNIVAPGTGVVWSASFCGPGCDDPNATPWAAYTDDRTAGGGYRRIAQTHYASMVGADQSTAFIRTFDPNSGVWSILACDRAATESCAVLTHDDNPEPSVYVDSGFVYWIHGSTGSPDTQGVTLLWKDAVPPYSPQVNPRGSMVINGPAYTTGLRVDGNALAFRDGQGIWAGTVGRSAQLIWRAPSNGQDVDINHGRVFWNQSANSQYPGCLGSANLDGTDGRCLDQGDHSYGSVRVDDQTVWFIRDGQIAKLPR